MTRMGLVGNLAEGVNRKNYNPLRPTKRLEAHGAAPALSRVAFGDASIRDRRLACEIFNSFRERNLRWEHRTTSLPVHRSQLRQPG